MDFFTVRAKLKFHGKNEQAIPISKKKATKFGLGVLQGKVIFLNIILREAEIVTIARNNYQLPSLFTNFKIRHKNTKIVIFFCTGSLVWYMLM